MASMRTSDSLAVAWVCGLGSGFIPKLLAVPGVGGATWGSLAALFLVLLVTRFFPYPFFCLLVLCAIHLIGSALLIERVERLLGAQPDPKGRLRTHDQNQIVIDEWLAVFLMSSGIMYGFPLLNLDPSFLTWALLIGTCFFRVIDILKPWPLSRLEKLGGWKGVIADDVVGGLICIPITLFILTLVR